LCHASFIRIESFSSFVIDPLFPSTRAEAILRAASLHPVRYARTRNSLGGHVSLLSPYLTHGFVSVGDVLRAISQRHSIGWQDKIVFELGWREYFHHVWSRLGDDIWKDARLPLANRYANSLPDDIRVAQTGVAIIDQQIARLYQTGYLHNHARMWIASYIVHIRKVDWRVGAKWMYAHLLDGDMASNTLSWQWVAGTWTGKAYLFNAENVERYAPGVNCRGSVIDTSYEELDEIARSDDPLSGQMNPGSTALIEPRKFGEPPSRQNLSADKKSTDTRFFLMHPWSLHCPDDCTAIGVINLDFHREYPWSERRWQFVVESMISRCSHILCGTTETLAAQLNGYQLQATQTLNPHYSNLIARVAPFAVAQPRAFTNPKTLKRSFSSFWAHVSREEFPVQDY
jgi:deoxyribodipyrimidine photo-lyase